MGGSLYNKIPLGRRSAFDNLSVQIAAGVAAVASLAAILLVLVK